MIVLPNLYPLPSDLFHVQQVDLSAIEAGHGGGVVDSQAVETGVVQGDEDALIDGRGSGFGAGLRKGDRGAAEPSRGLYQRLGGDPD